jgi:predicted ABC-class ATPase
MRNDLQAAVAHLEAMAQNAIGAAADADMPEQQKTALWAEYEALDTALREKAERERGCAYCVIGKRSPDAEYCSNCGRKLTPTLPELANESEEVNEVKT